jgi:hypothetical protein
MRKSNKWNIQELRDNYSQDELETMVKLMIDEYPRVISQNYIVRAANMIVKSGRDWAATIVDGFPYLSCGESEFIGLVTDIAPSQKYGDYAEDQLFWSGADEVLGRAGMSVDSGEGDPVDLFVYRH